MSTRSRPASPHHDDGSTRSAKLRTRERVLGLAAVVLWLAAFAAARLALEVGADLSAGARVAIALAPVPPYVLFLWSVVAHVRALDELHRRVHLEALATAFTLAMVLLMTLGLCDLAVGLPPEDFSLRHVWAFLPVLYFAALGLAWRRYR